MVSVAEGMGLGFLSLSVVVGLVTLVCSWRNDHRMIIALAVLGATSIPAAIVPQLVTNGQERNNMENYVSVFFLLVYPATITVEIVVQWYVTTRKVESLKMVPWIMMGGMILRLVFYTAWLGQYAGYGHHEIPLGILTAVFVVIFIASVVVVSHRVYTGISGNAPQGYTRW